MFKGKFVVLSLLAAALLSWQMMPGADVANSGLVNPCSSTASVDLGDAPYCYLICPRGDGDLLSALPQPLAGAPHSGVVTVTVKDDAGIALAGIPATDFWFIGCNDLIGLCGGSLSSNAFAATNLSGITTMAGAIIGGGCDTGLQVVVQGTVIADPTDWNQPLCVDIYTKSPDRMDSVTGLENPDLQVTLADFGKFGAAFPTPAVPNPPYDPCADYNCSGAPITLADFGLFGLHWTHSCG
jgi:hypothetical protein